MVEQTNKDRWIVFTYCKLNPFMFTATYSLVCDFVLSVAYIRVYERWSCQNVNKRIIIIVIFTDPSLR